MTRSRFFSFGPVVGLKEKCLIAGKCFLSLISAGLLAIPSASLAADVSVMLSSGFFQAYSQLIPEFERSSGHRVLTIRGPSLGDSPESIPARIKRGEFVDVVIMVGSSIDELGQLGLIQTNSKVNLARSQIGMVVRAGAANPKIGTKEDFIKTVLEAKSIAYSDSASGIYLSTVLFEKLGLFDQVKFKSRKIMGPPSGEPVAAVVARGEAEIGFQQVSELIHVSGVMFVGAIPAELQQDTFFSAAIATSARQHKAAETLIRYLSSPATAPAISQAGLSPISRP